MGRQSPSSDVKRSLRVYTLELNGKFLTLPINPQSTTFVEPARTTPQQTLDDHYVEEWGDGHKQIQLEGHTGYEVHQGIPGQPAMDGYEGFMALRDMLREYMRIAKANAQKREGEGEPLEMYVHIWEENEHWRVVPSGGDALRRTRSSQSPLLFNYTVSLIGVKAAVSVGGGIGFGMMIPSSIDAVKGELGRSEGVLGTLTAGAGTVADGLASARQKLATVRAAVNDAPNALGRTFPDVARFVGEARRVSQEASGLASEGRMAAIDALKITRNVNHAICVASNLPRIAQREAGQAVGPLLSAWNEAQRARTVC